MAGFASFLPIMQAAGTALSVFGQLQSGKASKQAAEFNEKINRQNAELAQVEARDNARIVDRQNYLLRGSIVAAQGASGGTQSGSVLDVIADAAAQGELEKQMIIYRGQLKARGYTNTADLDQMSGDAAQTGSYLRAGAELLSGGINTYKSYTSLKRTG